jgi:polyhydroxyalkanoate synthesis regulator phasin
MARKKTRPIARTRAAANRIESGWKDARRAFRTAEGAVGRRVAELARRSGIDTKRLARQADEWRSRLDREGRKARKRVRARLAELQKRAQQERRTLARAADGAVARALAALNIPTRRELQELSRRVEQLSSRVAGLRR